MTRRGSSGRGGQGQTRYDMRVGAEGLASEVARLLPSLAREARRAAPALRCRCGSTTLPHGKHRLCGNCLDRVDACSCAP